MDDNDLKIKLIRLGIKEVDAKSLIKTARYQNISIKRAFANSFMGTYRCVAILIFGYFFFVFYMSNENIFLFSFIYLSLNVIIFFLTPFFKGFFWSLKVLFALRER
ncbi:MAG: hypothetical protein ACRC2A_02400 [Enterobacterales bacterium]|uniref:hypothetical protein n=1 Tax=Serratia sp. (in: enterobacteria) TaxID=616 RepID=UPI003F33AFFD